MGYGPKIWCFCGYLGLIHGLLSSRFGQGEVLHRCLVRGRDSALRICVTTLRTPNLVGDLVFISMAGGRGGRGRGRGRGGAGVRQSDSVTGPLNSAVDCGENCGTCDVLVGDDAVGCDRCESWFHPKTLCLGLSDAVIQTIVDNGGKGVAYICTDCRAGSLIGGTGSGVGGGAGPAFKQLHQTVKMLCRAVETMSLQMAKIVGPSVAEVSARPGADAVLSIGDVDAVRASIKEEVREVEEQTKRKDSVIIRGLKAVNEGDLCEKFKAVSSRLIGSEIVLSGIVCINREKDMYRAKIVSDANRVHLLSKTKELPNYPDLQAVFIHRDLTFRQRQQVWQRRQRFVNRHVNSETARSDGRGAAGIVSDGFDSSLSRTASVRGRAGPSLRSAREVPAHNAAVTSEN